jgi:hypothetical protein
MSSDSQGLVRGGRILLTTLFVYLLISSVGMFLWRVRGDPSRGDFVDVLRFSLESALYFAVWRGWRWAKWLLVALCATAAIAAAIIAQRGVRPEEMRVVVIAMAVLYG